jgi:hypothetical protein
MNTLRNSVFICRSKVPARNGGSKLRAGSYQRRMRTRRCYFLARLDRPFICKRHTVHLFARQLPWRDSLHYAADKGTKGCADDLPYGVKHSVFVSKRTSCRRILWPMSFFLKMLDQGPPMGCLPESYSRYVTGCGCAGRSWPTLISRGRQLRGQMKPKFLAP